MSLLLALVAATTPLSAPPADALAGVAAGLSRWQGSLDASDGAMRCITAVSSGDAEIDAVGCTALKTCVPRFRERLVASNDAGLDAATRVRLSREIRGEITECLTGERDRLAQDLAARRARDTNGNTHAEH